MGIYVLQVAGGQERRVAELARRLLGNKLGDCFAPVRELKKRKAGQWRTVKELVFPGYLFLKTEDPENVHARLRQAPVLMRLLTSAGDEFLPLNDEEIDWLRALVVGKTHTVEMSEGLIEGGQGNGNQWPPKGPRSTDFQDRSTQATGLAGYAHVRKEQEH